MRNISFHSTIFAFVAAALLALNGCQEDAQNMPTQGHATMITSEDIYPAFDQEVKKFEHLYEKAHVTNLSSSARDAIVQLLNDSVKVIAISRDLNAEEEAVIKRNNLSVKRYAVAFDGVVVLVNEKNPVSRMTAQTLHDILLGRIGAWNKAGDDGNGAPVVVAMGDRNSSVYEYVNQRLADTLAFANFVVPCRTTPDVIDYIAQHRNAIGFVGLAWTESTPPGTKIIAIGDPKFKRDESSKEIEYFPPLQAHVYRDYYPLRRRIFMFTKDAGTGVGVGLVAFVTSAIGQKVFLTHGLVPATMPVRLVQFNSQ